MSRPWKAIPVQWNPKSTTYTRPSSSPSSSPGVTSASPAPAAAVAPGQSGPARIYGHHYIWDHLLTLNLSLMTRQFNTNVIPGHITFPECTLIYAKHYFWHFAILRHVSECNQSSTEEVAHELFHNIEQFTKQVRTSRQSYNRKNTQTNNLTSRQKDTQTNSQPDNPTTGQTYKHTKQYLTFSRQRKQRSR